LAEADPNTILTKKDLIEQLDDTKKKAIEIEKQQILAKETDIMLNLQREIYRPVANEGALLYFLIISLNYISHMY
jgi:dynein heavy chain